MRDTDIVDQLARYGAAVEAEVDAAAEPRVLPPPAPRPGAVALRLVAAVVVTAAFAGMALLVGDDGLADYGTTMTTLPVDPAGSWDVFPEAPIGTRLDGDAVVVSTGEELLVWGGREDGQPVATGAALSFDSFDWRPLAPSPLSPREGAVGVWTGEELVVWGGRGPGAGDGAEVERFDGAAYDPAADTWRTLPATAWSAVEGRTAAVWTGEEVVFAGVVGGPAADLVSNTMALDPAAGGWRALAPPPIDTTAAMPDATVAAAWTGEELLLVTAPRTGGRVAVDRLDPSGPGVWADTVGTDLSRAGGASIGAVFAGGRLVIVQHGPWDAGLPPTVLATRLFDPRTGQVQPGPALDEAGHGSRADFPVTAVGDLVFAGYAYLDTTSLTWHVTVQGPLPPRSRASAVAAGRELFVWGGSECEATCDDTAGAEPVDPGEGLVWSR